MTDNEKAATFIGWDVATCPFCAHPLEQHRGYIGCMVDDCESCVDYFPENLAPDMSRPENYMRALECGDFRYEITYYPKYFGTQWWTIDIFRGYEDNVPIYGTSGISLAEAIITVLVSVYDQDHPE